MIKTTVLATALAGTLDLTAATLLTLWYGKSVPDMLRYVASGPIPAATGMGDAGAILGVGVHYSLMAIMVIVFMIAARRNAALISHPFVSGTLYGLATYIVMNLIVVPVRFDKPLPPSTVSIVSQLFCHVVLVGIPTALIARRYRAQL